MVRFDDRLATILSAPDHGARARTILWAQIADILAQNHQKIPKEQRDVAISRLSEWRSDIPPPRRQAVSVSIARATLSPELVAIFGCDSAAVAAPILMKAQLDDEEWGALIPSLPPASRSLLRERRNLSPAVMRFLAQYGAGDFALPSYAPLHEISGDVPKPTKISDLVARIEAFQRDRASRPAAVPAPQHALGFRFETDSDGVIIWMHGASRGALIGMTIAKMAHPHGGGVDGYAAGAFRQRSDFQKARLLVLGVGETAGAWLISGIALFDPQSGRFTGYRGIGYRDTAQRSSLDGSIGVNIHSLLGTGLAPDSVRQLVHELRTPLNAIRGFSEMVAGQLLGPVSAPYRIRANKIVNEAAALMNIFDDLEAAARIETGAFTPESPSRTDVAQTMALVAHDYEAMSHEKSVLLRFSISPDLPYAAVDSVTCERLINRLVGAAVGVADRDQVINVTVQKERTALHLMIDRPAALAGLDAEILYDPSHDPQGEWPGAPPLGLGFALRLISNIAQSVGGRFVINNDNFTLILPSAHDSEKESKGSS